MILCCGLIVMCYVWSSIYIALFFGGMFISDQNLSRSASGQHSTSGQLVSTHMAAPVKSNKERAAWWLLFVLGLFLLSQLDNNKSTVWPWLFPQIHRPSTPGQRIRPTCTTFLPQHRRNDAGLCPRQLPHATNPFTLGYFSISGRGLVWRVYHARTSHVELLEHNC
jgi:hypothetical protein